MMDMIATVLITLAVILFAILCLVFALPLIFAIGEWWEDKIDDWMERRRKGNEG